MRVASFTRPLHLECRNGSLGTVRALFDAGILIDRLDDFGSMPIHCASEHEHVEAHDLIALLLRSGADLEAEVVLHDDNNYCHSHKAFFVLVCCLFKR